MAGPIVEAFSLSHAQVLDGSTTFEAAIEAAYDEDEDIYGVLEASVEPDQDNWDNEGDDVVLSRWSWLNYAEVNVEAGYLSFPLMATMYSTPVTSSSGGGLEFFSVDLYHEDSINVAPKPMIIVMPSKDTDGTIKRFVFGLNKVSFMPIKFDGPKYKDGLKINYSGTALYSAKNELGVAFGDGKKRIGRLLSVV